MKDQIIDVLQKIDSLKEGKFQITKENRIFLKRLFLDENFLNNFISKNSEDSVYKFLSSVLKNLEYIEQNLEEIRKEVTEKGDESDKNILQEALGGAFLETEKQKEDLIRKFIEQQHQEEDDSKKNLEMAEKIKQEDEEKIKNILNNLKNN